MATENMTLLAFADDRRAAVDMDRKAATCCRRAVQQSIDFVCQRSPQQQTYRTLLRRSIDGTDRQTDRRTDGRTDGRKTV